MPRARLGTVAAFGCVAAVAVAVAATRHVTRPSGSPVDPLGEWRTAWVVGVVAALAACGLGVLLGRSGRLRLGVAVTAAVAVQLLPLAGPLLLSQDAYLYWAEARVLTTHHHSPYRTTPSAYPADPGTRAMAPQWRTETEPYGPVWATVSSLPAVAAGHSAHRAQFLYRLLAVMSILGTVAIVALRTRSAGSVALLGWNPLIAFHFAGGGHSDALLALALVGALALGATPWGGALWPVAGLIKAVPAVALPLELARRRLQVPRAFWLALVGTGLALAAAATAGFGPGWLTASTVAAHGTSPIGGVHFLTEAGLRHRYAVVIGGLVFLAVYALLLRQAWRTGRGHLGFALAALCMCSSLLRPWYAVWPLSVAALEGDALSIGAAFALSAYGIFADALP